MAGRPRTRGLACWLSWAVTVRVAWPMSHGSAKDTPARAYRRKIRTRTAKAEFGKPLDPPAPLSYVLDTSGPA